MTNSLTFSVGSRPTRRLFLLASVVLLAPLVLASPSLSAVKPAAGKVCSKAGQKSGALVCSRKAGKLVWARSVVTTTKGTAAGGIAPGTTKPATALSEGIEGTWSPTTGTVVGYRVKEVLGGQDTEGVGRTSAVTGSMKITGTTVTSVELTADLTKLESDSGRRDDQVQGRILETAKFPTAVLKLKNPIDLGSVPGDKVEVAKSVTVTLTLHGVTKDLPLELKARRNGPNIEVNGAIKLVFADFGITNPSLPPFVTTDPDGLLEFLVVFAR
jgi:polyisoprenoid-binding protein YceI